MNRHVPAAILLTFSTYGSRLHGDARGSHQRVYASGRDALPGANPTWEAWERSLMPEPAFALDAMARVAVADAVVEACRFHGWQLLAQTVQREHVHVVVRADGVPTEVLRVLKARATTMLRERALIGTRRHVWTRSGHVVVLSTSGAIEQAVAHVDAHPQ